MLPMMMKLTKQIESKGLAFFFGQRSTSLESIPEYITSSHPSVVIISHNKGIAFHIESKFMMWLRQTPPRRRQSSLVSTWAKSISFSYYVFKSKAQCINLPLKKLMPIMAQMNMIKLQTTMPLKMAGRETESEPMAMRRASDLPISLRGRSALNVLKAFKDLSISTKYVKFLTSIDLAIIMVMSTNILTVKSILFWPFLM